MRSSYGDVASRIGLRIREARFRSRMRHASKRFAAFVLSFPKAGRTWHRVMLGYYLARLTECDPRKALDLPFLVERAGLKSIAYSHNGAGYADRLPLSSSLVASSVEWAGRDVLLIVRNPADTLVSAYYYVRFRERRFEGNLSEFIRRENTGIVKLLVALNRWYDNRHMAASFNVVSYEQMHRDPGLVLRQSLRFAGLRDIDEALVKEAIEFSSIENMRRYEDDDYFRSEILRNEFMDEHARKVRKGRIGSSLELNDADRAVIAEAVKRLGDPFARYTELHTQPRGAHARARATAHDWRASV
jgi:hypothetical protein